MVRPDKASVSLVISGATLVTLIGSVFMAGRYTGRNDGFNAQVERNTKNIEVLQAQMSTLAANVQGITTSVERLIEYQIRQTENGAPTR